MKKSTTPLISVVIPTYNHAQYLGRALQSAVEQSYTNWEAIVIDNHSTDNTDEVIKRFTDPRITYLKIHNNGVIAASRNKGIRAAKGELIAFLDSDDWWMPNKLEESIRAINSGADVVCHDLYVVRHKNQKFFCKKRTRKLQKPVFQDLIENGNALSNSSVVIKKSLLVQIGGLSEDKELISWEDYDCWLRIAKQTEHFFRLPKPLGFYWEGGNNISNPERTLKNLNEFQNRYLLGRLHNLLPWWYHYSSGICYKKLNNFNLAKHHFLLAWHSTFAWHDRLRIICKYIMMEIEKTKKKIGFKQ